MASEEVYVKGKVKWFRPHAPNEWGKWSHVMYLDNESVEKIRELQADGVKNLMKKDEDGYNMTFSRVTEIKAKGKLVGLQPPLVLMADGETPLVGVLVGNGSDVTTKLEVYQYTVPGTSKRGKAIRWKSSRIDNLVPFEGKRDFTEEQSDQAQSMADQPKPIF